MNSEDLKNMTPDELIDIRLRSELKKSRRIPAANPWLERRIMASLPEEKHRFDSALRIAISVGTILLIAGGWLVGGLWFLNSELSLTSLGVICSIPLTTVLSGVIVAAPALKRIFR